MSGGTYYPAISFQAIAARKTLHLWSPPSCDVIITDEDNNTLSRHSGQSLVKVIEEPPVLSPQTIELLCNLSDIPNNPPTVTGYWTKDGQEIENSKETVNRNNDQYIFKKT